jgi:hypothetical protein
MTLNRVAEHLSTRLASLFAPDAAGYRPCHGGDERYANDPHYRDLLLFHEYFHADTGRGLGASHQTGWTGVVAKLIHQYAEYALQEKPGLGREYGLGSWDERTKAP